MRLNNIGQPSLTVKNKAVANPSFHIQTPNGYGNPLNSPSIKALAQQHIKQPLIISTYHKNIPKNDLNIKNDPPILTNDNHLESLYQQKDGKINTELNITNEQKNLRPRKRRSTFQPQSNHTNQRPLTEQNKSNINDNNDNDDYNPIIFNGTNTSEVNKLSKNEITSSLNNLALINMSLKKRDSGPIKASSNLSSTIPPIFSGQKINSTQSKSFNKFKGIQFNILGQSKNIQKQKIEKKNETTIKIVILSNWGNNESISCSEIDILGGNHFPVAVNKIYVEPLNHPSTKIMKLINRDMIKNEKKDMWYAKWPPTPPLQKISLIIKVNIPSNEVESMRFWPTPIDPTSNLKSVEIYINNDPVFKGDLQKDFGQVISLKPILSDSDSDQYSEYEYEYEIDNSNKNEVNNELSIGGNFKVDFGYSNNKKSEITQNIIKKRIKRKIGKAKSEDSANPTSNANRNLFNQNNNEKDYQKLKRQKEKMKIKQMKDALNKIRSSKKKLSSQVKADEYGILPNPPIQNIEIRCFDSYESPDYFGYSWIRIFDSYGDPIDVRSSASIVVNNCGPDCPPPSVLFHEDENKDITHFDLWRAAIPKCDNLSYEQISQGLNSGNVLLHFTDLTLVSAIVIYTFRHPKDMNIPDISAKRVRVYIENKQIWAGRLKHSSIRENDAHAKEDDCATVIFLTAEPETQNNVLIKCFPSIYS